MRLSEMGDLARECWQHIPRHFPNAGLDTYVVMPNHIHGIVVITAGTPWRAPTPRQFGGATLAALATIVGAYKSTVTRRIRTLSASNSLQCPPRIWQRNYYEHVIRSERSLEEKIRGYFCANPTNWAFDPENPESRETGADEIELILARGDL